MRICLINLMPYPYTTGGVQTHLDNLAYFLIKKGHEVHVISPRPDRSYKKLEAPKEALIHNVGLPHFVFGTKKPLTEYFYRLLFELSFVVSAFFLLLKIKPHMVNVQDLLTAALPCSLLGMPFVATAHGIFSRGFKRLYEMRGRRFVSRFLASIYQLIERFNLRFCREVVCLGKETEEYYGKFCKTEIIPNGINLKVFRYKKGKRGKTIIFVGRFTKQKQPVKLVKAMDKLKNYKLLMIGFGPLESQVKEEVAKRKNCNLIGFLPSVKTVPFLQKARFTVLPSEFEGLPIAMLEAMACGCIPIATKVGDVPDVIEEGKNGFLLTNNQPETIVKKVKEAEKHNLSKISKEAAETIKEKYDWEKLIDKFIGIYERIIS